MKPGFLSSYAFEFIRLCISCRRAAYRNPSNMPMWVVSISKWKWHKTHLDECGWSLRRLYACRPDLVICVTQTAKPGVHIPMAILCIWAILVYMWMFSISDVPGFAELSTVAVGDKNQTWKHPLYVLSRELYRRHHRQTSVRYSTLLYP